MRPARAKIQVKGVNRIGKVRRLESHEETMSKRTKTRMGHANPTSERNRRKERHSRREWGVVVLPHVAQWDDRGSKNKKRRSWIARQTARKAIGGKI